MHSEEVIGAISAIVGLGILAQWMAWRLRVPAILLLLLFGFVAGPVTGWLEPDRVFGSILFPVVSLSVGIILFEGGLSLNFREVPGVKSVIFRLISVGMIVTWVVGTYAARSILGLDLQIAALLGAVLTVSGPTVILPLLRHVRPRKPIGSILKWEGILIDPLGALFALLVLEAIIQGGSGNTLGMTALEVTKFFLVGGVLGLVAGFLLIYLFRGYLIPDFLHSTFTLMILLGVFALSNAIERESGLLATTLMGIVIANGSPVSVRHILEFKENLRVLLISALFVLLAARLSPADLEYFNLSGIAFLAVLIFIARPLATAASTVGSSLSWAARGFVAWVAPRGIVAAVVAALFSFELQAAGIEGGELLVPYTFLVIIGTVLVYGLTAAPVAHWLNVRQAHPQGVLVIGAHEFSRLLAHELLVEKVDVLLVDTNHANVYAARSEGIAAEQGDILSENFHERLDLEGLGRLVALTSNDEANSLAGLHFREHFDRKEIFQLATGSKSDSPSGYPSHLRGRTLFSTDANFSSIDELLRRGYRIQRTEIEEETDLASLMVSRSEPAGIPLLLKVAEGQVSIITTDWSGKLKPGNTLIELSPAANS